MIRKAIDKAGRPMVLSLSPGPTALENAAEVAAVAQMWRISDDFWDCVEQYHGNASRRASPASSPKPPPGRTTPSPATGPTPTCCRSATCAPSPARATRATPRLTPTEQQTLLTLWAMARSPLILGANLTQLTTQP